MRARTTSTLIRGSLTPTGRTTTRTIADGTSRDVNGNGRADECECLVDLSGDGQVERVDLFLLLAVWGLDPGGPPDFDGDGTVAVPDLLELLAKWGQCE